LSARLCFQSLCASADCSPVADDSGSDGKAVKLSEYAKEAVCSELE